MARKPPAPTWFENALHKIAPGAALRRYKTRVDFMAATGAYEPSRTSNRPFANYTQFLTSPNSRTSKFDYEKLINFSRFLCMTSIGTAITNRLTDHAIGTGLAFRSSVDAERLGLSNEKKREKEKELTDLWRVFFQGENGHYERMYSGGYLQANVFKSMLEGGDNFVLPVATRPRKNHPFPFALQSIESERVSSPTGKDGDPDYYLGVQKNKSGVPVKIHIADNTDTNIFQRDSGYHNPTKWQARNIFGSNTGIRQVFQVKNLAQDRPGALRGIPFLTPVTGLIIDHKELADAVLKAAKIQSVFAVLAKGGGKANKLKAAPSGNQSDGTSSKFPRVDFTAGQIVDLPEGVDLESFESKQPNSQFTDHEMHQLAIIGAITGIPRSIILILFEKSFSASRGEVAMFWVTVLRNRIAFILQFLFPFWEYLLSWAVANNRISCPGFFEDLSIRAAWLGDPVHQFRGPRMPWLDREKEAKGLKLMRDSAFKSTRAIIAESFEDDPDATFDEWTEEKERGLIAAVANQTEQLIQENENEEQD